MGRQDDLRLQGRVMLGDAGVGSGMVVLHRVSPEVAGEVDSVSIAQDGGFEFVIPQPPSASTQAEILFASVRYEGVLYFGSAISDPEQLDSLYVINVFGSKKAPPEGLLLPLSVRNLFLERWGEGWRATDLFQILNGGERTLVAAEDGVVWSYPLPPGATSARLGQGDLPPDAVTFEGGRVLVRAPLPPGERMLLIRYELPEIEAEFPAPGATETLELLVKEPAPSLDVAGLRPLDVVSLDGESSYRRYSGTSLLDAVISLEESSERRAALHGDLRRHPGGSAGRGRLTRLSVAAGAGHGSFGRLGFWSRNRSWGRVGGRRRREGLILQVARLDESLEATTDPEVRRRMSAERTALMVRLRA